jgi:hypothetical protein
VIGSQVVTRMHTLTTVTLAARARAHLPRCRASTAAPQTRGARPDRALHRFLRTTTREHLEQKVICQVIE